MIENPLISVIVPVYNVEPFIRKCLESIIKQTYKKMEIIIVEDGSTDGSEKICTEYAQKDSRIILCSQKKGGVSKARNRALEYVSGEYVTFVDADDWLEPEMYELMYRDIIQNGADVVFCGYYKEKEKECIKFSPTKTGICGCKNGIEQTILRGGYQGVLWNKMFHKSLLFVGDKRILFDETLTNGEDGLWTQTVLSNAKRIYLDNRMLYHYRVRLNGANFNRILSLDRLSELEAYSKTNYVLDAIGTSLKRKNLARQYDKAHELRVISYLQQNSKCEQICKQYMKCSVSYFYESKDFSKVYKLHHLLMNGLITLRFPKLIVNFVNKFAFWVYGLIG